MYIEKEKLLSAYKNFENTLGSYSLPMWNELPEIELYMDQVIFILTKHISVYYEAVGTDKAVTPSMINNYVKLLMIPAPKKKKYSRVHLAYLFIICILKKTLDMATIQKIIPLGIDENTVCNIYNSFVSNFKKAYINVCENVKNVGKSVFETQENNQEELNNLLLQVSASANIYKILTEKITRQE